MDSFATPRLQISEIFLILFVISLWFISIVFCVRRSSLVLCFHKRDVPFYDSSLDKKKSNLSIVKSVTNSNTNNLLDNEQLCRCNNSNHEINNSLITSSNDQTVIFMKSCDNNHEIESVCSNCNKQILKNFSYTSNDNETQSKSTSDTFALTNNKYDKIGLQTSKSLHTNQNLRFSDTYNEIDSELYFSNGILYSTSQRTSSVLLNKALRNKFTNTDHLNRRDTVCKTEPEIETQRTEPVRIRSIAKNKHHNLVSLDEGALIAYSRQHKFIKKQQNPASTNALTDSYKLKKLNKTSTNKQGKLSLATPNHANFISLRSGSITSQGTYFKSGMSDEFDSYQTMLRPPSIILCQKPRSRSSSVINNSSNNNVSINSSKTSNFQVNNMSQRQMHPMSSLRRHMFANSHRRTQTQNTISFYEDSTNLSYETGNSNTSNTQLAMNNIQNGNNLSSEIIREDSCCSISENQGYNLENSTHSNIDANLLNPNYINPEWISPRVKACLIEHLKSAKSKSDSNIKFKNRSSNQLLHSYNKNGKKSSLKEVKSKKPLSLQNSQEKHNFYYNNNNNNSSSNSSTNGHRISASNFYDDLKNKLFQNKSSNHSSSNQSANLSINNRHNDSSEITNFMVRNSPSTIFDEELFADSVDQV